MTLLDTAEAIDAQPGRPRRGARAAFKRLRTLFDNPLLMVEFRRRLRGRRILWLILAAGGGPVLLTLLVLGWAEVMPDYGQPAVSRETGQALYHWLFGLQAFLTIFIAPALASTSITQERERNLYDLIASTPLAALAVVMGKAVPAFLFGAMLLLLSAPTTSICFLYGGVGPHEVVAGYALLTAHMALATGIGIFWSAMAGSTVAAVLLTYGTVLGFTLLGGFLSLYGFASSFYSGGPTQPPLQLILNPFGASSLGVTPLGFFGAEFPAWTLVVPAELLLTLVLLMLAANRLECFPSLNPAAIVAAVAAAWLAFLALATGGVERPVAAGGAGAFGMAPESNDAGVFWFPALAAAAALSVPLLAAMAECAMYDRERRPGETNRRVPGIMPLVCILVLAGLSLALFLPPHNRTLAPAPAVRLLAVYGTAVAAGAGAWGLYLLLRARYAAVHAGRIAVAGGLLAWLWGISFQVRDDLAGLGVLAPPGAALLIARSLPPGGAGNDILFPLLLPIPPLVLSGCLVYLALRWRKSRGLTPPVRN